jgi:hypothetical protein
VLFKLRKDQQGGIVLEAALLLPLFLVFVLGLIMFIQIALMEFALQAAVTETTKTIATQLYPARLLIQEAKARVEQTQAASVVASAVDRVKNARATVIGAEEWVDEYAAFIPDPILTLLSWEKDRREQGEGIVGEEYNRLIKDVIQPQIHAAFTPIVLAFGDRSELKKAQLKVISVTFPGLESGGAAVFGIEAQLEFQLALPFIRRTLVLKKRAYERAWFGA